MTKVELINKLHSAKKIPDGVSKKAKCKVMDKKKDDLCYQKKSYDFGIVNINLTNILVTQKDGEKRRNDAAYYRALH